MKKIIKASIIGIYILLISLTMLAVHTAFSSPQATANNTATLTFSPLEIIGPPPATGETFLINVTVQNVTDLFTYDITVSWNSSVLNYVGSVTYFTDFFKGTFGQGMEHYYQGKIVGITSSYTEAPGASGSGTLFQVKFLVIGTCPCQTWINATITTYVDPSGASINTLIKNAWFQLTPKPLPGSALLTESAPPYYVGSAISFSGAGSTQGFNGTATVPLKNATLTIKNSTNTVVYQNTIVNSSASAYLWSWTPTQADTYYATLTVNLNPAGQTTPPKIPLVYTDGPYTKTVTIKPSTFIACWTASARWGGYTAATVGLGVNQSADAYTFDENVTMYSIVVYNNQPMAGYLVSFTVYEPNGQIFLFRSVQTNGSGIANMTFRIPTEGVGVNSLAGKWECFQKVYMCQEPYTDTLWWDVGYIVQVTSVTVPPVTLVKGTGTITVTINYQNIAEAARNVIFSITVYDNNTEPIGSILEQLSVAGGTFCCPATSSQTWTLTVPTWAKPGSCSVYVDLYNKLPTEGGSPWGSEVSQTFMMTATQ